MPRLAYLLKKFPRLSETFVLNEVLAQEALGRELAVFSRRAPDDEPRHPELARLKAEVELMPPSKEIDPWTALFGAGGEGPEGGEDGDPEQLFAAVGRVVRDARAWNHPRFGSLLAEALWLKSRCAELGVEHVHTHFATDSAVAAMLLHALGGPSYSITAHAKDIYRSTVDPALLNRLFARSEFVVTVCDANVRHLESMLSPDGAERVRRLYNGIDLGAFGEVNGSEREDDHVLSIGRLVAKKGFDVFIEAIALMRAQGRNLRATIIGSGEDEDLLRALIAERGVVDTVTLAGALPADEVRAALGRATVFCLPCVVGPDGNRDALPTVLIEALAAGVPIVSTPVTGIPEILDNGRCGALVPENDAEATARAVAAMLDAPDRRARLAAAGRAHAAEHFDLERQSRVLAGWFDEVLERKGAACTSPA